MSDLSFPEHLEMIVSNTLAVMLHSPEHREHWKSQMEQMYKMAVDEEDLPLARLVQAIGQLVSGNPASTVQPRLGGPHSDCWARIIKSLELGYDPVRKAVFDFVNARSMDEMINVLMTTEEHLKGFSARYILSELYENYKTDPTRSQHLKSCMEILERFQVEGIGAQGSTKSASPEPQLRNHKLQPVSHSTWSATSTFIPRLNLSDRENFPGVATMGTIIEPPSFDVPVRTQKPQPIKPISWRTMRVFISSTFKEMFWEREKLVKETFPMLRKFCDEHGVLLTDVDLRWGITDERKAEKGTLALCLAEIERCRPYFIGLLGESYGTILENISTELTAQYPWLSTKEERSITELEITAAVLTDSSAAKSAFFYFRDPTYSDNQPEHRRDDVVEVNPSAKNKVEELKQRIRESGANVKDDCYTNLEDLDRFVLEDFKKFIDHEFPLNSAPDSLDRERVEHEAYAHFHREAYVEREKYFKRLEEHVNTEGPPLVVLGESGVGKSALLANWYLKYCQAHPDHIALMHFVGASAQSTDWAGLVRRILGELKRRFDIQEEIPTNENELSGTLGNWLRSASLQCRSSGDRIVIIIDALDALEDHEGALNLTWLPDQVYPETRLILSTLPGRPLEEMQRRECDFLEVTPLDPEERIALITGFLQRFGKELPSAEIEKIARLSTQTSNPLYLRTLLEEIRLFGRYDALSEQLAHYLKAPTAGELFRLILKRYEKDYEEERPGLVKDMMSFLWASRRGLTEKELLDLLGSGGTPLSQRQLSLLQLAAGRSMVSRSGYINFSHEHFRYAVEAEYLKDEQKKKTAHSRLAEYFADCDFDRRKVEELPWQLQRAESWSELAQLLFDLDFFINCWNSNEFDVRTYWTSLERHKSAKATNVYQAVVSDPLKYSPQYLSALADLFSSMGYLQESFALYSILQEKSRQEDDKKSLLTILIRMAEIYRQRGDRKKAQECLEEVRDLSYEVEATIELQAALGALAAIKREKGNIDDAIRLGEESIRIARKIQYLPGLASNFGNQALSLMKKGDDEQARKYLDEVMQLTAITGDLDQKAAALEAFGSLESDPVNALSSYKDAEQIYRELGRPSALQKCLGNHALVLSKLGKLDEAMQLWEEQEKICHDLCLVNDLLLCMENQALAIMRTGEQLDKATKILKKAQATFLGVGDELGPQHLNHSVNIKQLMYYNEQLQPLSLQAEAEQLYEQGRLDEAIALYKEAESLIRVGENDIFLPGLMAGRAKVLFQQEKWQEAQELLHEVEKLSNEKGFLETRDWALEGQILCLPTIAKEFEQRGEYRAALAAMEDHERACRLMDNTEELWKSTYEQAFILFYKLKEYQKALKKCEETIQLLTDTGSKEEFLEHASFLIMQILSEMGKGR